MLEGENFGRGKGSYVELPSGKSTIWVRTSRHSNTESTGSAATLFNGNQKKDLGQDQFSNV